MKGKSVIVSVCVLIVLFSVLNACNPSEIISDLIPMEESPEPDLSGHSSAETDEPQNQQGIPIPLDETDAAVPESQPLPTEEVINDASDPTYVYDMVKLAVANKDVSYLEEFYTSEDFDIYYSPIASCGVFPDWETPPLEIIEDHIQGELECLGLQYTKDHLTVFYAGWEPDWEDCNGFDEMGRTTDVAGLSFSRNRETGNFVLGRIQTSGIRGMNMRCCGREGAYPYNLIPCNVEKVPDIEQAICPDALPQRMRIGGVGMVCSPEGAYLYGYEPADPGEFGDLDLIPFGFEFNIISGPFCIGDGKSWYKVNQRIENILVSGYIAEGGSEEEGYYLCPKDEEWEQLLKTVTPVAPSTCPGSPPQRLHVGESAMVCQSVASVKVRDYPGMSGNRITSLRAGTRFEVIGGPECAGNNWSWWKVRLSDGTVGWMAEGGDQVDQYYLCPVR